MVTASFLVGSPSPSFLYHASLLPKQRIGPTLNTSIIIWVSRWLFVGINSASRCTSPRIRAQCGYASTIQVFRQVELPGSAALDEGPDHGVHLDVCRARWIRNAVPFQPGRATMPTTSTTACTTLPTAKHVQLVCVTAARSTVYSAVCT